MTCINCGKDTGIIGIEIPDAYDGVSFWKCFDCRTVWSRWTHEIVPDYDKLSHTERAYLARTQRAKYYENVAEAKDGQ